MVKFTGGLKSAAQFRVRSSLPPTWLSVTNLGSNHESKTITESPYSVVGTDPEDDPLTYSFVSGELPTGATLNSDGTITGPAVSVTANQQFDFTASVTDNVSSVNKAFFITVNENANPTWVGGTDANLGSVDEDSAISIQLTALDADGLPMALSYSEFGGSFPAWLSINGTGLLTGTAPSVDSVDEPFMFTVTASDGLESADRQFTLTIAQVFAVDQTFTSNDTYVVPANVTVLRVKTWGAGGGAGDGLLNAGGGAGGGGGFIQADISVTPSESLTIIVGAGGILGSDGTFTGGGGGSFTAIERSGSPLIIAGSGGAGGGGGGVNGGAGGPGGGTSGGAGGSTSGQGGTQIAGGAGGFAAGSVSGTAGSSEQGGAGGNSNGGTGGAGNGGGNGGGSGGTFGANQGGGGGGGGAGFFGGGGGKSDTGVSPRTAGSGGGGSSTSSGSNVTNTAGSGQTVANNGDSDYVATRGTGGTGGIGVSTSGIGGLIVVMI